MVAGPPSATVTIPTVNETVTVNDNDQVSITVGQTITFSQNAPASAVYNSSFMGGRGWSNGNPVLFTSSGACTNSGATYTMTSGPECAR